MHRALLRVAALTAALATTAAFAEIKTKTVTYKEGKTTLKGFVAWDDAAKDKRPGVLVIHEWWGLNKHAKDQAIRAAKAGYVGFSADMFGGGKTIEHPKDAGEASAALNKDPAVVKARFDAALAELKKQPTVDPVTIGVLGYCMGGAIALSMARGGEDLHAVSTFHAVLSPPATPAAKGTIKARILVNNGAADPMATTELVEGLRKELTDAGARFEIINYPDAKHGFTNPEADKKGVPALGYSKAADEASWENTMKMFKESFGT